ncbi:MAG: hypothetical protein NT069_30195 [Planctomycetota bacterium]|nr:hypothetical protein [Planctomycetota bacterium]
MSHSTSGVDATQHLICEVFASLLDAGASQVRVRVVLKQGAPTNAWFYSYVNHDWHKAARMVTDPVQAAAVKEQMEFIGTKGQGEAWHCRQHGAADIADTDIAFHSEKIHEHLGTALPSLLLGMLFRDNHDSRDDNRQVRRGSAGH